MDLFLEEIYGIENRNKPSELRSAAQQSVFLGWPRKLTISWPN